jgi:hypothetical protein
MQHTHEQHPISAEGQAFLASITSEERALQILAQKMLGSSYFVEKTHAFQAWLAKQPKPSPSTQFPAAK